MTFKYNDINNLKKIIKKYKNKISCLVIEPATSTCPKIYNSKENCCSKSPCSRNYKKNNHYLKQVEKVCKENKIIFILDEMITGFRWHLKGAQHLYNLDPDLSTFGKAMANGFSVACVAGKKKLMELGSITNKKQERVFLLSTTHGAEMSGLGAFVKTVKFLKKNNVLKKNWDFGYELISKTNKISRKLGLSEYFFMSGPSCSPIYTCLDKSKKNSLALRTLFMQEMLKNKVFIPWIAISYSHKKPELKKTLNAIIKSLKVYKKALFGNINKYLKSEPIKPVFRKFN
jgi:glutamate-1-semialdehyde 2,1-aminomutase